MSDTGHDNWGGYTVGESEGKWSHVDSGLMKYERRGTLVYGSPTSEAYRDGWERIFGRKTCPHCGRSIQRGQTTTEDGRAHSGCEARACPTTTSSDS